MPPEILARDKRKKRRTMEEHKIATTITEGMLEIIENRGIDKEIKCKN
jgi:hypothetical protein